VSPKKLLISNFLKKEKTKECMQLKSVGNALASAGV